MTHGKSKCTVTRNWIFGGYSAEYRHSEAISSNQLSDLIDGSLRTIRGHLALDSQFTSTRDFKGRDAYDAMLTDIPGNPTDEIFRIGGSLATSARGDDGFEWSSFDISCRSAFKAFEGAHHITHALSVHRSDAVPDWLPWHFLGAAAPVRPQYLRLGLQKFQSRFTMASFGFIPQVTDSFLIDVAGDTLHVVFRTEQRAWRLKNPVAETPIFSELSHVLTQALDFDLVSSFETSLRTSGKFK